MTRSVPRFVSAGESFGSTRIVLTLSLSVYFSPVCVYLPGIFTEIRTETDARTIETSSGGVAALVTGERRSRGCDGGFQSSLARVASFPSPSERTRGRDRIAVAEQRYVHPEVRRTDRRTDGRTTSWRSAVGLRLIRNPDYLRAAPTGRPCLYRRVAGKRSSSPPSCRGIRQPFLPRVKSSNARARAYVFSLLSRCFMSPGRRKTNVART